MNTYINKMILIENTAKKERLQVNFLHDWFFVVLNVFFVFKKMFFVGLATGCAVVFYE